MMIAFLEQAGYTSCSTHHARDCIDADFRMFRLATLMNAYYVVTWMPLPVRILRFTLSSQSHPQFFPHRNLWQRTLPCYISWSSVPNLPSRKHYLLGLHFLHPYTVVRTFFFAVLLVYSSAIS